MEQSIFNTELTPNSNNLIYSASRWSRFLGIVFFVFGGLILIGGLAAFFLAGGNQSEIFNAFNDIPQYAWLANIPSFAIALVIIIGSILTAFIGYLFFALGKNGIDYYNSQDEQAFEKTFASAKQIFLVTSIATGLGILFTLISLFVIL